ncbi:MAG: hypothetical protein CMI23_10065 [Opitutae bacterium]|nr:hypothetical protein [Opitutae bacterium]
MSNILNCLLFFLFLTLFLKADDKSTFPGEKPYGNTSHALYGAKIHISPEETLKVGTILIRNGLIEKTGEHLEIPPGYREWNCSGKTIYAGFIDPYIPFGPDTPNLLDLGFDEIIQATSSLAFKGLPSTTNDFGDKGPGFETSGVTPEKKLVLGFQPEEKNFESLRATGFTAAHFTPNKGIFRGTGPCVLLEDKDPNELILKNEVAQIVAFDPVGRKQTPSIYPNSLMGVFSVIRQTFLEVEYSNTLIRYQKQMPSRFINEPHPGITSLSRSIDQEEEFPLWFESGSFLMTAKAIDLATELKIPSTVFIANGYEWQRPDITLLANHDYILPLSFPSSPKFPNQEDWEQISLNQLRAWNHAPSLPSLMINKTRSTSFTTSGCDLNQFRKNIKQAINRGLSESDALASLTVNPAKICGIENSCGTLEKGKLANFLIVNGESYFEKNTSIHSTWIRGTPWLFSNDGNLTNPKHQSKNLPKRIANFPTNERKVFEKSKSLLFKNFKIWTCEQAGILNNQDLYVEEGIIRKIGNNLTNQIPKNTVIIDGKGKHLTPGIIDCHSHAMILGGVNESSLPSTAMVRISDVINSESANIERQLAGGVTTCNLLHGSANPIGGQNAVVKLKFGSSPKNMIMKKAPSGIKFALGENVKQANWGNKYVTRFPQTRMGVKTFFENRFNAALNYEKKLLKEENGGLPCKRNLELQALLEILSGERLIHCHSYRQDEIVVFLRTMENFGIQVGSLQHVLEGYKVAEEIAQHGAGASTFSDWWAYKFEVYDAIPYAGALMHKKKCVVSFNSDSPDHARRMNFEAAKAVKYGGLTEEEALNLITLNPARQLKIDKWTGSISVGKDADFAIWTGHPFDYRTKCYQTWIEGKLYHDINLIRQRDQKKAEERERLINLAKKAESAPSNVTDSVRSKQNFFRISLENACDLHIHSCRTNSCMKSH